MLTTRSLFLAFGFSSLLLMSGCGMSKMSSLNPFHGRKSFEPEKTASASAAITKTGKEAVSILRDGVTFSDGTFLTRGGISAIRLPKGFHFVTRSGRYVLAADDTGAFKVLDSKSGKTIHEGKLEYPLVSAAIRGQRIYYVSQDNRFGVYSLSAKKTTISAKVGRAFAVDTRIANPISLGSDLVVPTLDGKLLIINPANPKAVRGLAIGDDYNLNNVIFLKKLGGRIIAATPKKLISAAPGAMHKYEAPVGDVTIAGHTIYLLTGDGRVVKLSPSLKVLAQRQFPYAQFAAIAVVGGRVYALDRSGALIVMDSTLKKSRIYDVGSVDDYAFVAGSRLYKDDEVIDLSKLSF
ncbi:PQQ-binding-like beta-propeller repeat protein [Nitratifractor sp.]|uniref:outer membrane protein assembly factor BamB family protein n=1 Tax=Nitratifractor sp. TaxID=2268144 RepID=UPI0025E0D888|nr:PQQ-binding-like beta-propeller repeat protein [Nitratifractor sp.]